MITGWMKKYKVNRTLYPREKKTTLSKTEAHKGVKPRQLMGLIRLNSTYIDWIDSPFRIRGMMESAGGLILLFVMFGSCVSALIFSLYMLVNNIDAWPIPVIGGLIFLFVVVYVYWVVIRHELFTYTHYPVRFNRKNRMVYVFKHNGKDGVLAVPFDEVYFHLGMCAYKPGLMNMRGEIMEGDIIRETFGFGNDTFDEKDLYEDWEFIRTFMEEGPAALEKRPEDKFVHLSVASTWRNHLIMTAAYMGIASRVMFICFSPIVYWLTATRWFVLKTCKEPVFPPEVENACQVEHNDLHAWTIPEFTNQY